MQTITKKVYTFKELLELEKTKKVSKASVDKAREILQGWQTDDDWYEYTVADWNKRLESVGFTNPDIRFSGFSSQGDGASFTANVDLLLLISFMANPPAPTQGVSEPAPLKNLNHWRPNVVFKVGGVPVDPEFAKLRRVINDCEIQIKRGDRRYSHKNTCGLDWDCRAGGVQTNELWRKFVKAVEAFRSNLCDAIYRDLEKEYDYLISDKALIELSDANDHLFDASGDLECAPRGTAEYGEKFPAEQQIQMEERIASMIFDNEYDGLFPSEEDCANLGKKILKAVLSEVRPDLFK